MAATLRVPFEAIDGFISEQMELGQVPGVALSLVRNGEVVYRRGYGYADLKSRTPMSERTGVVIGSTTKALTCAAVIQLSDRGLLDLDDPIARYVPSFRGDGAARQITIRQAITHTAGLPPSSAFNPHFLFSDDAADDALERYVDGLSQVDLIWPPGTGWIYSNDGFVIAGRIVEIVSGMGYEEYMRRNVFTPLELTDAAFSPDATPAKDLATPHDFDADGRPYASFFPHNRAAAPAGSQLIMSARDAGRWLRVMLDQGSLGAGRLISARGYAEMVRPQPATSGARGSGDADTAYGLGWLIGKINGIPAISHGGATITMGSQFICAPRERLGVAVVANSVSEATSVIAEGVMSLALGRAPARSFPRVDWSAQPDRTSWPRLAGTYHAREPQNMVTDPWPIQFDGRRLFVRTYPGDERRRPGDIFLYPLDDSTFVLFGRGRTGKTATFEIDGDDVHATWEGVPIDKVSA